MRLKTRNKKKFPVRKKQTKNSPAVKTPRKGWSQKFKEMHKAGEDKLLIPDVFRDEEI